MHAVRAVHWVDGHWQEGQIAISWRTVSSIGPQVGGELMASEDSGARDPPDGLEKPAVRFSHLSARSQSLVAELAPRLKPPAEPVERWIVARGRSRPPPLRFDLRTCDAIAPHENNDDISHLSCPQFFAEPLTTVTAKSWGRRRRRGHHTSEALPSSRTRPKKRRAEQANEGDRPSHHGLPQRFFSALLPPAI